MYIVTGANGFIGSAMVKELNSRGLSKILCVDSVSLSSRPLPLKGAQYSEFILADQLLPFLKRLPRQNPEITAIIHMGACSSTTEMDRDYLYKNNTLYTQNLFEWCHDHNIPYIYASSGATYGQGEVGFSDQIDPDKLHPLNPYGDSKLAFDRWVVKQPQTPSPWYGLRFFNVFGPNEHHKASMASLVYKSYFQVSEKKEMSLFKSHHLKYADGEQMRDFVYVKDITRWMWELLEKRPPSGIYNMGFGQARTWLDLAKSVFQSLNVPLKIKWLEIPENIRNQYQYFTEADMTKWKNQKLSAPQWSLEKGINDYIQNYLVKNLNIFGQSVK